MAVWHIEVYDNKTDQQPSRTGFVEAATEQEATQAVISGMGAAHRADMKVTAKSGLPAGRIFWLP